MGCCIRLLRGRRVPLLQQLTPEEHVQARHAAVAAARAAAAAASQALQQQFCLWHWVMMNPHSRPSVWSHDCSVRWLLLWHVVWRTCTRATPRSCTW
jgi:hypothetical protein